MSLDPTFMRNVQQFYPPALRVLEFDLKSPSTPLSIFVPLRCTGNMTGKWRQHSVECGYQAGKCSLIRVGFDENINAVIKDEEISWHHIASHRIPNDFIIISNVNVTGASSAYSETAKQLSAVPPPPYIAGTVNGCSKEYISIHANTTCHYFVLEIITRFTPIMMVFKQNYILMGIGSVCVCVA